MKLIPHKITEHYLLPPEKGLVWFGNAIRKVRKRGYKVTKIDRLRAVEAAVTFEKR